jgi:sec-independent protein translocase protein TatA
MGGLQPWHIAILAVIVILVFGSKKLPDAARGVGRSLRIFKSEIKGLHDDDDDANQSGAAGSSRADATVTQPEIPAPHVSPAPSNASEAQPSEVGGQRR